MVDRTDTPSSGIPSMIAEKYEVLGEIGKGGMGAVYRVRHVELDEVRALKVLPDHLAENVERVARFRREAQKMARFRHDNIVRVYDFGRDRDLFYLVLEYVDGLTLAQFLRHHGPLSVLQALDIARQVAGALAYAHVAGVTHRDVKPSNILIEGTTRLRALLIDFGIAKVEDTADQTRTDVMLGTYKYCAPEQLGLKLRGTRVPVGPRADVYALGLVLHEMLEGTQLLADLDTPGIIGRVVYSPEELLPEFTRPVPTTVRYLIQCALRRDPEERFVTMEAMLRTIEGCLRDEAGVSPGESVDDIDALEARIQALRAEKQRRLALAAMAHVETARERAEAVGAPGLVPLIFNEAAARRDEGSAAVDRSAYTEACELFDTAARRFDDAAAEAAERRRALYARQARTEMNTVRADAEQAGAAEWASEQFQRALVLEAGGDEALARDAHEDAQGAYMAARGAFADAVDAARRARERHEAERAHAAMVAAREEADRLGAGEWAVEIVARAAARAQEGDAARAREAFGDAISAYGEARVLYADAAGEALAGRRRHDVERARQAMEHARQDAGAAGADRRAHEAYTRASARAADGETAASAGAYVQAEEAYAHARRLFIEAADAARAATRAAHAAAEAARSDLGSRLEEAGRVDVERRAPSGHRRALAARDRGEALLASGQFEAAAEVYAAAEAILAEAIADAMAAAHREAAARAAAAEAAAQAVREREAAARAQAAREAVAREAAAREAATREAAARESAARDAAAREAAARAAAMRLAAEAAAPSELIEGVDAPTGTVTLVRPPGVAPTGVAPRPPAPALVPHSRRAALYGGLAAVAAVVVAIAVLRPGTRPLPPPSPSPEPPASVAVPRPEPPVEPAKATPAPEPVPPLPPPLAWARTDPAAAEQQILEGGAVAFAALVADADRQGPVRYLWTLDGREQADTSAWTWATAEKDAGRTHDVTVTAARGDERIERAWRVRVTAANHAPTIASSAPAEELVTVVAGTPVTFSVSASDPDLPRGDRLAYAWERNGESLAKATDASFTLGDARDGDRIRVAVRDRAGESGGNRTWRLAVNTPPRILAQTPPAGTPVALEEGASVEFTLRAEDPDSTDRLHHAWSLDGREVARTERWRFTAPALREARSRHRVVASVADGRGLRASDAAWDVEVTAKPPRLMRTEPRTREVAYDSARPQELRATAEPAIAGVGIAYEWSLDGAQPVRTAAGRYPLPKALAPGRHAVEVTSVDARGLRSESRRWSVAVPAPAPTPAPEPPPPQVAATSPPPLELPPASAGLTEVEVRDWLRRVERAWSARDVDTLHDLGVVPDHQVAAVRKALAEYERLDVSIRNERIVVSGDGARVTFDRQDVDEMGSALDYPRQTFRLEKGEHGVVAVGRE